MNREENVGVKCWKELNDILRSHERRGGVVEGNFSFYDGKVKVLKQLVRELSPSKVLEIGFNCGHSACIILSNSDVDLMITCDTMHHLYSDDALSTIRVHFPAATVNLFRGDTKQTLPWYSRQHPSEFDLILIDGGHDFPTVTSDLRSSIDLVRVGGLIILDDINIPDVSAAADAVDTSQLEKMLEKTFKHNIDKSRKGSFRVYRRTS